MPKFSLPFGKKKKQKEAAAAELQQLYNTLMFYIEPELMTDMVPLLDEMYKDETEEDKKLRTEWYAEAFEIFAENFAQFMGIWKNELVNVKKKAHAMAETGSKSSEQGELSDIEQSIQES